MGIAQFLYIIQRKFQKIQRKISKISILKVLAVKPNRNLFNAIGVQSIRPYASFDTHIAISKSDKRQMAYALNMAFLAFLT